MTLGRGLYGLPEPEKPIRSPSRLRWVIRIPLIIFAIIGVSLTTLAIVGGNSDSMKENLERYLNDATGMESHIGTLNGVHFFPEMGFDAEDVTLKSGGEIKASVDSIRIYIPFWNVPLNRSEFRDFHITGMVIEPGIITPRRVEIDQFIIDRMKSKTPLLVLDGRYGGETISLRADMKSRAIGASGGFVYSLADKSIVEGYAGEITIKGALTHEKGNGIHINMDEIRAGDNLNTLRITVAMTKSIVGTIESGESKAKFTIDLGRGKTLLTIKGNVDAEKLDAEDISGDRGLVQSLQSIKRFYLGPEQYEKMKLSPYDLSKMDLDIETHIQTLLHNGVELGDVSGRTIIQGGYLNTDSLRGRIRGGDMKGSVRLDATNDPTKLDVSFDIHGMDYSQPPSETGKADIIMTTTSTGNNADTLWSNLQGKITIVAGPGDLTDDLSRQWTGTLLPEQNKAIDCGYADFIIKGPIASTKTFVLNTSHSVVSGEGTLNLEQGIVNIEPSSLSPSDQNVCQDHLKQ